MKWVLLLACWVLLGCGVIFGIVHGLVPHLLTPDFFPKAQAREATSTPVAIVIADACNAVREGAAQKQGELAKR